MIPALYHLHFLVTKDRTELLQNLRLLCCVLTSARNWMQALPCSSAVGIVLVESGLVPRRDCQGSIVGNLELYVPENAEDNSVLPEVRADVQTFRDLHEELRLIVDPTADETWSSVLRSCRDAQVALEARMRSMLVSGGWYTGTHSCSEEDISRCSVSSRIPGGCFGSQGAPHLRVESSFW